MNRRSAAENKSNEELKAKKELSHVSTLIKVSVLLIPVKQNSTWLQRATTKQQDEVEVLERDKLEELLVKKLAA